MRVVMARRQESVFNEKLNTVNKKLAKIEGGEEIQVLNREVVKESYVDENGIDRIISNVKIDVSEPEIVKLPGIEFIGTISYRDGIKSIYNHGENDVVLGNLDDSEFTCEQCGINRYRVVFHFFKKDGVLKSVGSECAKIYFGLDIEKLLSAWQSFEKEVREENWFGGFNGYWMEDVLLAAMYVTDNFSYSWISQAKAAEEWGKSSTSEMMSAALGYFRVKDLFGDQEKVMDYWKEHRSDARALKMELELYYSAVKPENDFDWNVREQLFDGDMKIRDEVTSLGIVGYAAWAMRHESKKKEETVERKASEYQGQVGEKIQRDIVVKFRFEIQSRFGSANLIIMEDSDGNSYKWFSSGRWSPGVDEEVHIEGKVKAHDIYHGNYGDIKQTVLTRCKELA